MNGAGYGFLTWLGTFAVICGVCLAVVVLRSGRDYADGYLPAVLGVQVSVYGGVCMAVTAVAAAIVGACAPAARVRRRACITALVTGTALAFAGPLVFFLLFG